MNEHKQKIELDKSEEMSGNNVPKPETFVQKVKNVFKHTSRWILRVIQGAIIGAGAILPGISGGVLCVVFGIYQPMMALLAHPIKTFKIHAKLLFPVLVGWAIGFVGLAGVVTWMFSFSNNMAVWLFIGLIAGMVPSLYKDAGKEGRPKSAWISLIVSTLAILAILILVQSNTKLSIQPNIWWFFVCGILWGISLVVPGMSSSSILIYLGLYDPMAAGIKNLDPLVLIPMLVGVFLIIFISARAINYLFKKHYAVAFHMILGFVIASTLVIIPLQFKGILDASLNLLCFVVGFILAWLMDKLAQKMHYNEENTN